MNEIHVRPTAMFVECHANVHAGVVMDLISGGRGKSVGAEAVLRSTLTNEVHRVPDRVVVALRGMSNLDVGELLLDVECKCEVFYPDDLR